MQCILHGLTSVLLVSRSSLLTAKGVDLVGVRDGFLSYWKLSVFFIVATLIAAVLFEQFLICNAV